MGGLSGRVSLYLLAQANLRRRGFCGSKIVLPSLYGLGFFDFLGKFPLRLIGRAVINKFLDEGRCGGKATQRIANAYHTGSNPVGASNFFALQKNSSNFSFYFLISSNLVLQLVIHGRCPIMVQVSNSQNDDSPPKRISFSRQIQESEKKLLLENLGFHWQSFSVDAVHYGLKRAVFRTQKILPEFIFDMAALEGNPFTYPEVQTLLEGVTVGGRRLSDQTQILDIAKAWKAVIANVAKGSFAFNKAQFLSIHKEVAANETWIVGSFQDQAVVIGGTKHRPPEHTELERIFDEGLSLLKKIENVHERAYAFFLFGSLNQFFLDGNKRSSRLMTAGELLKHGFDTPSIPADKKLEFNQKMIRFYDSRDGTEMMAFLNDCLPK